MIPCNNKNEWCEGVKNAEENVIPRKFQIKVQRERRLLKGKYTESKPSSNAGLGSSITSG
jgi:hypothetical protein